MGAGGILAVGSLLAVLPAALGGRGSHASVTAAKPRVVSAPARAASVGAGPVSPSVVPRTSKAGPGGSCQAASGPSDYVNTLGPSDYVNPLARARVTPERIDQGVDYAGSGTLVAIGAARVTYMATSGTGWPGPFIEYRLLDGPDAGCYVYYAEGVNPAAGLRAGETVAAGQPVASIISGWSTGIELGWGAGITTVTYAAKTHQWSANSDEHSTATAAGKSFSALIASLGGPPGKVEG
jgi:hypothetical protein